MIKIWGISTLVINCIYAYTGPYLSLLCRVSLMQVGEICYEGEQLQESETPRLKGRGLGAMKWFLPVFIELLDTLKKVI